MDNKLILVKSVTLLYRESLLPNLTDNSTELVRTILSEIKLPEVSLTLSMEREYLSALRDTAYYLCTQVSELATIDREDLLQRLKVNCGADDKLYDAYKQGIEKDMDEPSLKRTVLTIRKFINDSFRENEIVKLFTNASRDLLFNRNSIKHLGKYAQEFSLKLEPYLITSSRTDPAVIDRIDMGLPDSSSTEGEDTGLESVFSKVQDTESSAIVMKTGWKGLNRMLQGGFRKGETWTIGALPHNYKTGMSLTLFKQLAIYNTPVLKNPDKKPLLIRISFEDNIAGNFQFLYQNLYENEFKKRPRLKDVTAKEMAQYTKTKLKSTGYHLCMLRVNPSDWTYKDIQNFVIDREAEGYEIHLLMLDYLPMVPTKGCEAGPAGHDLRDLYRRMRNFTSARDILMITPHQLSTDAKQLHREGQRDYIKKLPGTGMYAGSKQIDQELDGELYIAIEKRDGKAYLAIQRGKHRLTTTIAESDKYIVLPFPEKGTIPDDLLEEEEITLKSPGGSSATNKESAFFEYDTIDPLGETELTRDQKAQIKADAKANDMVKQAIDKASKSSSELLAMPPISQLGEPAPQAAIADKGQPLDISEEIANAGIDIFSDEKLSAPVPTKKIKDLAEI